MSIYTTPNLPEGYYFQVDKHSKWSDRGYLRVVLKRKRKFFFDYHVAERDCVAPFRYAVENAMKELKRDLEIWVAGDTLCGSYPPKKL